MAVVVEPLRSVEPPEAVDGGGEAAAVAVGELGSSPPGDVAEVAGLVVAAVAPEGSTGG